MWDAQLMGCYSHLAQICHTTLPSIVSKIGHCVRFSRTKCTIQEHHITSRVCKEYIALFKGDMEPVVF